MEIKWYLPFRILSIPSGCLCRFLFFLLLFPDWPRWLIAVRLRLCCRFGLLVSIGRACFIRRIIFDTIMVSSFLDCMRPSDIYPLGSPASSTVVFFGFFLCFFFFRTGGGSSQLGWACAAGSGFLGASEGPASSGESPPTL